jgi:probable DNA repair protein
MANALEFQPEGNTCPVQVLGELESSGLVFDALWVLGLHDTAMPRSPSPNPFIPLPVQRAHKMKRADAERELEFAGQVVRRLFSSAPEVVLSWPMRENGAELRPSPFIKHITENPPAVAESNAPDRALWLNRPELEELADNQGPSISSRKPFTGGTGIIKDQALCPFRAFAHHRLRAERLDEPDIGIDSMSRGTLVHTVLEFFWERVVDLDTLLSLDEPTLFRHLNAAVDGALERFERERRSDLPSQQRKLERARLHALASQWLKIEARRGRFRVLSSEETHLVKIGNLAIKTRIDRIDELDDGTCAIIDYKTGQPDPLQWLDARVTEPQLPVYCLGLPPEKVGAVMFALVRSKAKESGFRGLARAIDVWPGAKTRSVESRLEEQGWNSFDDVLSHWQETLPALGNAFARGDAAVDPVDPELACKYCDLKCFCRILEQETLHGRD